MQEHIVVDHDPIEKIDKYDRFERREERLAALARHQRLLAAGWLLLLIAFAGLAWYVYPMLTGHDKTSAQVTGMHKAVDAMGDQVKQTGAKLDQWTTDQQSLRDQVNKLGQSLQAKVEGVAKQAQGLSDAVYRRVMTQVQAQMDERFHGVQTRLANLETARDNAQNQVAELRSELSRAQSELANQSGQIAGVRNQTDANAAAHAREFANLRQSEETNRNSVGAIEHQLAVHRVNFEVAKNHSTELGEGVSLGITNTDITHRSVSGWMWVMPDRRTIWLKNQNANQPVIFYSASDGKKRELVITNVARGSATGYLVMPGESGESKQIASVKTGAE
jgi:predicted RNase H-like nuclease (RuvC/YqgF family)